MIKRGLAVIIGVAMVAAAVAAAFVTGSPATTALPEQPPPIRIDDAQVLQPPPPPPPTNTASDIHGRLDEIRKKTQEQEQNPDPASSNYDPRRPRDWLTSGPFQIDRSVYAIGENIFVRTGVVPYEEKGQMAFYRSVNATHERLYFTIPFDGLDKSAFNQYFKPSLSPAKGTCTIDDIAGQWRVVFRGTGYDSIGFAITDTMVVPGEISNYEPVC